MKKLILIMLAFATLAFAKTNTLELTGEYSKLLGNPFKKVINTEKKGTVNIFSTNKDIVLKVDHNLERESISLLDVVIPDKIVFKNKTIEEVVEDFYMEDYSVNRSEDNAIKVNVISGSVYLTYHDEKSGTAAILMGVEVTLNIMVNGVERKVVMDQDLLNKEANYFGAIKRTLELSSQDYIEQTKRVVENIIYSVL